MKKTIYISIIILDVWALLYLLGYYLINNSVNITVLDIISLLGFIISIAFFIPKLVEQYLDKEENESKN